MVRVSIIVAAYNVADYIRGALDSAIGQTMREIEIICVDDGSTDETPEILQEYAARDSRVRVIRQEENKGPFAARHAGVMAATGEYVLFLDGDDAYVPQACERLYKTIVSQKLDVLDCGASLLVKEGALDAETLEFQTAYFSHAPRKLPQSRAELLRMCFIEKDIRWTMWGKLYALDLLKKACAPFRDERIVMAEDMLTVFLVFFYAKAYGYLDEHLYCYRWGSGISTGNMPPTVRQLQSVATEYQVHTLLCTWLSPEQRREPGVSEALDVLHTRLQNDIFHYLLQRALPEDCPAFLKAILQYCTLEEFVLDLAETVAREDFLPLEQVAFRLRDCEELFPKTKAIRTVASFYHRLANGGLERVMALLAPIWQSAGYRVVIVTEQPPDPRDYPLPEGVQRAVLSSTKNGRARAMAWKQIIREYEIDAVVYHAWNYENRVLDALAIKLQQIPLILYTHGIACCIFDDLRRMSICQEATNALSDVIVTLSEADQAWWQALGYRSICTWNPLTYRPAEVHPSALQGHDVLWVARISPEKQYEDAFEIASLVHRRIPDFKLHMVGGAEDPKEFERIQALLAENDMASYIILHGFCTDVEDFYQNASAILLTSESEFEGSPMVVTESKAFGVPLVTYELPNVSTVRQEQGMFVVPQRDCQAAADRLVQLLEDDTLRRRMGDEARRSAEEIAERDLGAHWKKIFDLAATAREPHLPLYRQPPLTVSLCLAMRKLGTSDRAYEETLKKTLKEVLEDNYRYSVAVAQYAVTVEELQASTAYRLGQALTALPRRIKNLLTGLAKH